jgi:hypothetical protein
VLEAEFRTLWWVPESASKGAVRGYLNGLERAEKALQADLQRYLPLWKHSISPEFAAEKWDFTKFGRGERFVYQPFPREDVDVVFDQVARWDLDQYLKDKTYEHLTFDAGR